MKQTKVLKIKKGKTRYPILSVRGGGINLSGLALISLFGCHMRVKSDEMG